MLLHSMHVPTAPTHEHACSYHTTTTLMLLLTMHAPPHVPPPHACSYSYYSWRMLLLMHHAPTTHVCSSSYSCMLLLIMHHAPATHACSYSCMPLLLLLMHAPTHACSYSCMLLWLVLSHNHEDDAIDWGVVWCSRDSIMQIAHSIIFILHQMIWIVPIRSNTRQQLNSGSLANRYFGWTQEVDVSAGVRWTLKQQREWE
jgi:hypothetical protein